jgi:hypothetical protein
MVAHLEARETTRSEGNEAKPTPETTHVASIQRHRKQRGTRTEGVLQPEPQTGRGHRFREARRFYRKLNDGKTRIPKFRNLGR